MSHANGQVKFKDGMIFHCEYNGTADVMCNCLYDNYEDMSNNWRKQPWNECVCEEQGEEVEIATDYGGGYYWKGKACKKCGSLTENLSPDWDVNMIDEDKLPKWWIK